ncbi:MAG: hypothetical protein NC336_05855 [Clostridium sp.]|nr:hypothetical protein [Clostridium sp.]
MSTVILKWNPGFSSYTMARFLGDLEKCAMSDSDNLGMNWSVWDYENVHEGDTFYLLKVGYGQTGIAARGVLTSKPYPGEDWSWKNRPTQYCDIEFQIMINPDAYPLLDSRALASAIPGIDWTGGHSGIVLSEEESAKLDSLWQEYMRNQSEYFERASDHNLYMSLNPVSTDSLPYSIEIEDGYRGYKMVIEYHEGDVTSKLNIFNYERILGKFGVRSWRALRQLFLQKYTTIESLQALCGELFKHQIEFSADFFKSADETEEEEEADD